MKQAVVGQFPQSPESGGGIKEALTMSKRNRLAIYFASHLSVFLSLMALMLKQPEISVSEKTDALIREEVDIFADNMIYYIVN